ncbi:Oligopeptide ABC transporter, permease protein [Mycoplasma yeatsii 13926]|uniref:Oligopeptide ABC transporter, permease protein n=1 Tax=Mycoplasma yeatsii 13926 TaxID=1188240 RepID=S6G878_9MOLU|nr:oligopeptide ABC transporter permease OppB [Mycoplasma yeatsii]EOA07269.1 Oligopeptide ABC transporter, permease protein [Mycoplasma yeatsii 13926]
MKNKKTIIYDEKIDFKTELLSEDFDLSAELDNHEKISKLTTIKYWYSDLNANIYKFFVRHPLYGYSFKRIVYGLITLLIAIVLLYAITRAITPDVKYLPPNYEKLGLSPKALDELLIDRMKKFGVYGPFWEQVLNYLKNITPFIPKHILVSAEYGVDASGNWTAQQIFDTRFVYLGVVSSPSIAEEASDVFKLFKDAMPYSFAFGSIAILIANILGILIGIQQAKKKNRLFDSLFSGASAFLVALPSLVIVLAVFIFSVSILGSSGLYNTGTFATKFWPIVTMVIINIPIVASYTRRYVLEEMTADYVKFTLSKGMSTKRAYYLHIFRNSGIRTIRTIPSQIILTVFGSSILTETQWSIPGMGQYIIKSAGGNDFFVFLGFTVLSSFATIFASLLSDLIYVWLDPRISLTKK